MNANFCILYFYFLVETEPEAPRSETLVAGLRSVLAILLIYTFDFYIEGHSSKSNCHKGGTDRRVGLGSLYGHSAVAKHSYCERTSARARGAAPPPSGADGGQ